VIDSELTQITGQFWRVDAPTRGLRGTVTLDDNQISAIVHGEMTERRTTDRQTVGEGLRGIRASDPDVAVAEFEPYTVHGTSDDGTLLTLVDVRGSSRPLIYMERNEKLSVTRAIVGAHVTGADQLYRRLRFAMYVPEGWGHLDQIAFDAQDQLARFELSHNDYGELVVSCATRSPVSLPTLHMRVVNAMTGLAQLCHGDPITAESLEVSLEMSGSWLRVLERPGPEAGVRLRGSRMVSGNAVTPHVVEQWMNNWARLGSIADPVVNGTDDVPIEVRALTLSAVAEGFHSRLFGDRTTRLGLSTNQIKTIRRAARIAGMAAHDGLQAEATDTDAARGEVEKALQDSFAGFGSITFAERMEQLATITSTAVHDVLADFTPERIFPFASWEELITKCRNTMAHQSITSVGRGTDDRHYDLLICSAESLTWVLKLLTLREAGIDIRHLRTGLKSDSSFAFYRANMRTILNAHRP
jgi:hypothetical protein